jgi:hypothetical protein
LGRGERRIQRRKTRSERQTREDANGELDAVIRNKCKSVAFTQTQRPKLSRRCPYKQVEPSITDHGGEVGRSECGSITALMYVLGEQFREVIHQRCSKRLEYQSKPFDLLIFRKGGCCWCRDYVARVIWSTVG